MDREKEREKHLAEGFFRGSSRHNQASSAWFATMLYLFGVQ